MKTFLKWTGIVLLGLVIVLLVAGFVVTNRGASAKAETHTVTATLLSQVPTDSATIARGSHLAKIHACADCHTENYAGQVFIDAPPFITGASNLTPGKGGVGNSFSVEDWDRAIRYGVRPDGSALMFMPSPSPSQVLMIVAGLSQPVSLLETNAPYFTAPGALAK